MSKKTWFLLGLVFTFGGSFWIITLMPFISEPGWHWYPTTRAEMYFTIGAWCNVAMSWLCAYKSRPRTQFVDDNVRTVLAVLVLVLIAWFFVVQLLTS